MSHLLWKSYLEDNVDKLRSLLANGAHTSPGAQKSHGVGATHNGSLGALVGSPGTGFGTSPRNTMKTRKSSSHFGNTSGTKAHSTTLARGDLNSRDQAGLTILHRAASSMGETAIKFALILIDHPSVDIYLQDHENGWTALHRALYFGNVTIARALLERDSKDSTIQGAGNTVFRANSLIKIKDHEGNSAFDVYNATIARRTLRHRTSINSDLESEGDDDETVNNAGSVTEKALPYISIDGDEIFAFGSNKNLTLGFGDEDDRQHPEKVILKRPDRLLRRFHREYLQSRSSSSDDNQTQNLLQASSSNLMSELPTLIKNRPIIIQDVALSKLHSAILTTDPESNLYVCGFGKGGRLGTGDEVTRFNYVPIETGALEGKKIVAIALGLNHSVAVSSEGEIFSWGTNAWGQLGYSLPRPAVHDAEAVNSSPRQIFGPLKREIILGVAASSIHSVAHTSTSLYTWGKNEGQLGLMDSDSRSLEVQNIPRKVAASLFTSSIEMVSAINRATICLLSNHSVWVFTNYGYNIVKFPLYGHFSNYHLDSTALTTRYESEQSHISLITSGGDSIAAVSSRGDLFTFNVSQKPDTGPTATSTTNPAKIRNALSQPQRIWSLRKGHWDGIKSVNVGENGSVIICTQAGAVWRRVRRTKIKDAFASGTGDFKSKDYKFQRVPGLTNVAAVRSNIFGAYAAIRKDCDVTKTQILVGEQELWNDLAPLLSLRGLKTSESENREESNKPRFWTPAISKEHFDPLKRAVLMSLNLEADVARHINDHNFSDQEYDVEVCTSLSSTSIPVHGFLLSGRSSVLREALGQYRKHGSYSDPELMTIMSNDDKVKIEFQGLDFITILNLVLYVYVDTIVDVWNFTRHSPTSAYRYRQIRIELMKLAAKLGMHSLEAAVRLMREPELRLNTDLETAFRDSKFFENGDAIVELDGGEIIVHSVLLRQRCPFFEGLFNGRAAGQWLAGRRSVNSNAIKIDMKHIEPSVFQLVLRYLYVDIGTELFDDIMLPNIDDFCDLVMDVMGVANELMLERLSQICQQVLGRFVNTRNVCSLVNAVAPCAVTELKDTGLEYMCLQLETMLENYLVDDLEDDLLLELDEVIRANQLACLPFAKSDRAEILLHERHPSLAGEIDEERQRKIRDLAFKSSLKDEDTRLSSSFHAGIGSLDDKMTPSPSQEKLRRKSKPPRNAPFSPAIHAKDSAADLMFDMDDEDSNFLGHAASPRQLPSNWVVDAVGGSAKSLSSKDVWRTSKGKAILDAEDSPLISPLQLPRSLSEPKSADAAISQDQGLSPTVGKPWSSASLSSSKLNMREIMAQASTGRTSTLSTSLSTQKAKDDAVRATTPKISQKERKKQQQQTLQQAVSSPQLAFEKARLDPKPLSPWQVANLGPKTSLKDLFGDEMKSSPPTQPSNSFGSPVPPMTLSHRRTASPDTRFSGQQRSLSGTSITKANRVSSKVAQSSRPSSQPQSLKKTPLLPHSKSYTTPTAKAEPSLQLSMADIIGQQKREQDLIKEAVAKRSLQEIQEEQAFQEWWDQESRRAQEEEAGRANESAASNENSHARGRGRRRGRGGSHRGKGDGPQNPGRGRGSVRERLQGASLD